MQPRNVKTCGNVRIFILSAYFCGHFRIFENERTQIQSTKICHPRTCAVAQMCHMRTKYIRHASNGQTSLLLLELTNRGEEPALKLTTL